MKNYDLFEKVKFCLGNELLLENMALALSVDEFNKIIEYIARSFDILYILEGEDENER